MAVIRFLWMNTDCYDRLGGETGKRVRYILYEVQPKGSFSARRCGVRSTKQAVGDTRIDPRSIRSEFGLVSYRPQCADTTVTYVESTGV